MLKTECTPLELAIIYNMAAPIALNNNAFNKDTAAVSLESHLPNTLKMIRNINNVSAVLWPD